MLYIIYSGAESLWALWRRANGIHDGEPAGFVAESLRASRRKACGICGGEPAGFAAESLRDLGRRACGIWGGEQMGFAAGIKRAKAPPREGEAFAVRGLAVSMAGACRCRRVSFCFTECFILFHPSILSRCTRVSYLVSPECFISFQSSVSSCCTRRADER